MLETKDEWLVHGFSFANYLNELGDKAQSDIYWKSSVDLALRDAFRKMRKFLMTTKKLTEDEAISLITIGVDFGITQVVDGNWGVHAVITEGYLRRRRDLDPLRRRRGRLSREAGRVALKHVIAGAHPLPRYAATAP